MEEHRPDPESLLLGINKSEGKKGKLKIFFGYAAGVGKTFTMLAAAHQAKKEGVDVVIGYVEPHARPQTLALLDGLEQIPPKDIHYKGVTLKEFDIDAALSRKPELILMDELAHTNASGSRHLKRYQDVEELLKAGIDVYTTVNVQHLESLNDVVESVTGIAVQERIPDRIFNEADQVELIDIEPKELIDRLNRGEIYKSIQAEKALNNFFTHDNLAALRSISLRRTADKVNIHVNENKGNADISLVEEHILLCLSSSPYNAKVVRTAARMAEAFKCRITALYVERSNQSEMTEQDKAMLVKNSKLAEQLGAKIVKVYGDDISRLVAEYAKASGVTKIVMGRPARPKFWIKLPNMIDKLSVLAPSLEIFVIPNNNSLGRFRKSNSAVSLSRFMLENVLRMTVFLVAIVAIGILLFVLRWYVPAFIIMVLFSFSASAIARLSRRKARVLSLVAYRTEVLLETSQKLHSAKTKDKILSETVAQIVKLLNKTVILYPASIDGLLEPIITPTFIDKDILQTLTTTNERSVAEWVFKNKKHAGVTTNTLPSAKCLYMAINGLHNTLAVVGIFMQDQQKLEDFDKRLLIAILTECALAIEAP